MKTIQKIIIMAISLSISVAALAVAKEQAKTAIQTEAEAAQLMATENGKKVTDQVVVTPPGPEMKPIPRFNDCGDRCHGQTNVFLPID